MEIRGPTQAGPRGDLANRRAPVALIAGATLLVVLVLGAGAAFFFGSVARVSSEHAAAISALESVRQHNNAIHAALSNPSPKGELSSAGSIQEVKAAMDDYRAQVGGSIRTVESDLVSLKAERDRLSSAQWDPLTFSGRSQLSRDRQRVEAATAAFDSADKFLSILDSQLRAINTALQAMVEFDNVVAFVNADDVSGGLALVPQLQQRLKDAAAISTGDKIPPQVRALIDALTRAVGDLNQALLALQRNDVTTAQAMSSALDADGRAVDASFDKPAFDAFEHKLLDPYRAAYEQQMRNAGFALTG